MSWFAQSGFHPKINLRSCSHHAKMNHENDPNEIAISSRPPFDRVLRKFSGILEVQFLL
jgi:hypothetical protein